MLQGKRCHTQGAGIGADQSAWSEVEEVRLPRVSLLMKKNRKNKALKGSKSNRLRAYLSINSTLIRNLIILASPAKILPLGSNIV
jgi:hypothetical protein